MTKVFPTRWCTGASMGPQKPLCHRNLWWILYFIYLYTNHFQETNIPPPKKKKAFQNGGQWSILFRIISISAKIWKNTFPKEFFNGIWVMVLAENCLAENYIFPHPSNADSEKTTGFVWFIYFIYFILFCLILYLCLFICLFIFLRQKKGIHEGDT